MSSESEAFKVLLRQKSEELYRDMPWRRDTRGYYVLVSEIMLQQTQVERVLPKFEQFIERFPSFETLATASLSDVLVLWSGLGYNRRAKFLHNAAKMIVADFGGVLPMTHEELVKLPGVGPNTAGALLAYVYNQPVLFVETNIRTVYFYHFFADQKDIDDAAVLAVLKSTLDEENPREFYWALMDYGASLKRKGVKNVAASKHYRKQSSFAGSVREVRGQIIRALTRHDMMLSELQAQFDTGDGRFEIAFTQLLSEELVQMTEDTVSLTN